VIANNHAADPAREHGRIPSPPEGSLLNKWTLIPWILFIIKMAELLAIHDFVIWVAVISTIIGFHVIFFTSEANPAYLVVGACAGALAGGACFLWLFLQCLLLGGESWVVYLIVIFAGGPLFLLIGAFWGASLCGAFALLERCIRIATNAAHPGAKPDDEIGPRT
jgi:hypothetical protein